MYQQYAIGTGLIGNVFTFLFAPPPSFIPIYAIDVVFNPDFIPWNSAYWFLDEIILETILIELPSGPPQPWNIILEWNIAPTDTWNYLDFRNPAHPQDHATVIEIPGAPDTYWLPGAPAAD